MEITEYRFEEKPKMHGVKRVLIFCILIVILPATLIIVPLYLRKTAFADVIYPVAESDIIEIRDGISSIFCQQHSLKMNTKFNAFQLRSRPEISTNRKHIRLKKSMTLPDDTLEYWGFYLLKGAKVHLKFCSRYDGSKILVVKGQRELKTCGLLDHNQNKLGDANYAQGREQVKVFFEDITEIAENIPDDELERKAEEAENHGGEDMSDYENHRLPSPVPANKTARPKKLKKGSPSTALKQQQKIEDETKDTVATLKPIEAEIKQESAGIGTPNSLQKSAAIAEDKQSSTKASTPHSALSYEEDYYYDQTDAEHRQKHEAENERRKQEVYDQLYKHRTKREHVYDRKYSHGGNAVNFTETDESNSVSSFENGLFECFNGDILLAQGFPPLAECWNTHFLENGSHRMFAKHEIKQDGYYYYIFYSDNDLVRNDIHAIFDIYKPTFQYSNLSDSQGCVNATNCTFPIGFLSDEIVVVEVPTRDGIEHEEDDITYLISTCHPRTEVYAIFPITVLILILGCSFL